MYKLLDLKAGTDGSHSTILFNMALETLVIAIGKDIKI